MDDNMYVIMRYHWSEGFDGNRWDDVEVVAMSIDRANQYMRGWKCPDNEYEPIEGKDHLDSKGRLWRFFKGEGNDRMTMRIDTTLLV
ncbi:hypothetical protein SEA_LUCKYSOCKE_103 [Streptomyces phage LuckySocke]|jgi:hypothetical protein|nr:hypothetical protein SEA_ALONE_105 [Streptomyces phage Alone3]WPH58965.1 hypothetical protein SEA_LUCKYSOCKE_103 [Streptomyces phage LuckySocke]